jgi:flagellar hook-associated protein 2
MASTNLAISGLASGFDWQSLVDQLAEAERTPERTLQSEQSILQQHNNAYTSIKTQLGVLQNRITALQDPGLFNSRTSQVSDATTATASVSAGAPLGSYNFKITQLASAAKRLGAPDVGQRLSATNDVSSLVLADAGFNTAPTAGVFTVNGKQITLATSDTLQQVFDKISAATNGTVSAAYDAGSDKITLSSASEIVLGSASDTSNFLQVTRLRNNGSGTITSSLSLGGLKTAVTLNAANFATALDDGGSGAGQFKINGVTISWSASGDSLANVVDRINASGAGVLASYDATNDQVMLTNSSTGDVGIGLEDVTGNFLAATGLATGTFTRGTDLEYSINDGPTLVSQSNTIDESSSGLAGLSLTAFKLGSVTVSTASDTTTIKKAITDFLDAYNQVQSIIDTNTASSTDATGKVTAGLLAGESDALDIASSLRSTASMPVIGLAGTLHQLDDLGLTTNGHDNNLTLQDADKLGAALAGHLDNVKALFTDSTNGIATKLASFLDKTIGDNGTLVTHQTNITKQCTDIDTQVADLERTVQADIDSMTERFVAMESAQATISQQLAFLQKQSWFS